ncbi:toxin-antitoxin system YwqK family antitoxin [Nocardia sp. 004]|uniref:toxin-antitoxin system YwqK family antitoxin n=1 Tax=Nocardia sp. 004 TaxID=3385978 RepID=UPI0039A3CBE9
MLHINVNDLTDADFDDPYDYYYEGKPFTGELIETTPTGEVIGREMYKDGVPDGPLREGYPNGDVREEGRSINGHPVGEWREWHANG